MFQLTASAAFGLEGMVARELERLGMERVKARNGGVDFVGGPEKIVQANLHLRCADRVFIHMGAFDAVTFDQLFEGVKALPWADLLSQNAAFPVRARAARSQLMSLPDIQAISKKAIVESLKARYHTEWFQEDGPTYPIEVSVHTDHVTVQVDTSGAGLNRRGYRTLNAEAPIRETLAAALVILSPYRGRGCFVDPLCGSGTIAIEAAMLALNMAPGLKRAFAAERWPQIRRVAWLNAREEAIDTIRRERLDITGSDIDPKVLELARFHAQQAGLAQDIRFVQRDVKDILARENCVIVCNPPYGERLGEQAQVEALYRQMGKAFGQMPDAWYGVITANKNFPRCFGHYTPVNRKFYNGRLECHYYQYAPSKGRRGPVKPDNKKGQR
ncbi:MAG: THUMP domain-containing class I SAM-dependent RNA methyltransferase [Christensenellales bacterium]|jgi:putative N6-adenine-specific DNA methylase